MQAILRSKLRIYAATLVSLCLHATLLYFVSHSAGPGHSPSRSLTVRLSASSTVRAEKSGELNKPTSPTDKGIPEKSLENSDTPRQLITIDKPDTIFPLALDTSSFFLSDQLTVKPEPLGILNPDILDGLPKKLSGKLILTLWIGKTGKVEYLRQDNSSLPPEISKKISNEINNLKFRPGELHGTPVGSVMRVEIALD